MSRLVPYSREVYLSALSQYAEAIWPVQAIVWLLLAIVCWMIVSRRPAADRTAAGLLAALWVWCGLVWHGTQYAAINWAGFAYAGLFVLEGMMLFWSGTIRGRLVFRPEGPARRSALLLIAGGPVLPPVAWLLADVGWRGALAAPLTAAPLAVLTLGLLLTAAPRTPWHLLVWPLMWSLIAGATAWTLGLAEGFLLPAAALVAIAGLRRRNRDQGTGC